MTRSALAAAAFAMAIAPSVARAEPACGGKHPWVLVGFDRTPTPADETFLGLLRAELASRDIDACAAAAPGAPAPVASIAIAGHDERVVVEVSVRDAVTSKRLSRDVDLHDVPADGRPLTLALAVDELLRASWAELALASAPPPKREVPVEVRRTVQASIAAPAAAPPAPEWLALGLAVAADVYRPQTLFGVDVAAGVKPTERLALLARFGVRSSFALATADGEVRASAVGGGAGASFTLTPPRAIVGADALARLDVERLSFAATARAGAIASSGGETAWLAAVGARPWWALTPRVRLFVDALASLPLRPARASDAGAVVAGTDGLGMSAGLGLTGAF